MQSGSVMVCSAFLSIVVEFSQFAGNCIPSLAAKFEGVYVFNLSGDL